MRLIPEAKAIAIRAYSMWANYLGILCLFAPEVIYLIWERDTNPRVWWFLGLALIIFGAVGRLVDQDRAKMRSSAVAMLIAMASVIPTPPAKADATVYTLAEFDAVAVPLIAKWEGLRTKAYLDTIASPPIWTVCYGETKGVRPGDSYTADECAAMLAREIREYRRGLHEYFTPQARTSRLTAARDAAYTSLAYNAGVRAIGKSTATRRLNAGDIRGGCEALGFWNRAGGRVVRGLVNRRADETALCLRGLA